ncbi:PH domain-containing protein [Leptospira levettii]|uniref:PH domain-containing protein n=1 Tax=Leptospira levettii TaxID=2023178 RepID=UPI001EEA97FF|nr:PH domain-containing protein [Leptospira levettii]MCG6146968.1 PH domain-containing protein [Leptospira levettii]
MLSESAVKSQILSLISHLPHINIDILYLYTPEFKILHQYLVEDEIIQGYTISILDTKQKKYSGGSWLLVLTNKKFHLFRNPPFTEATHIPIEFNAIKTCTTKKGWLFGKIYIETEAETFGLIQVGKKDYSFFLPALTPYLK